MRTWIAGTGTASDVWPETRAVDVESLLGDPSIGPEAVAAADAATQRLRMAGPLRFGVDPGGDVAMLRLLAEATARLIELDWTLRGEPPWPVRALVHLLPPSQGTDPAARRYADRWRRGHRFGQCSYRHGPNFVRMHDTRPGGPPRRILITEPWTATFKELAAGNSVAADDRAGQLAEELVRADLALCLSGLLHVLPIRLRRWPTPHPELR